MIYLSGSVTFTCREIGVNYEWIKSTNEHLKRPGVSESSHYKMAVVELSNGAIVKATEEV